MRKSKVRTVDDIKKYCEEMQKKAHSNFQMDSDSNAKDGGLYNLGGSVAYRDVLDFINKEPPHDD